MIDERFITLLIMRHNVISHYTNWVKIAQIRVFCEHQVSVVTAHNWHVHATLNTIMRENIKGKNVCCQKD